MGSVTVVTLDASPTEVVVIIRGPRGDVDTHTIRQVDRIVVREET